MFFVFGKLVTALLHPIVWLVLYFIYYIHKGQVIRINKYTYLLFLLTLLSTNKVFVNQLGRTLENKYALPNGVLPKKAVVLGGFCDYDQDRNTIVFFPAADRLFKAVDLYKTHKIDTMVISGGSIGRNKRPEAEVAKAYLIKLGIPAAHILTETTSVSTFENAVNCRQQLGNLDSICLITSAFHMPRASQTFAKAGFKVVPYSTQFTTCSPRGFRFIDYVVPSTLALFNYDMYVKEWLGWLAYKITGKL